jgi:hypothetical protein
MQPPSAVFFLSSPNEERIEVRSRCSNASIACLFCHFERSREISYYLLFLRGCIEWALARLRQRNSERCLDYARHDKGVARHRNLPVAADRRARKFPAAPKFKYALSFRAES